MIVFAVAHVIVDHLPHIAVNRVPSIVVHVAKPLAIQDSGWAIFAAWAAAAAAIATTSLALLTWSSVKTTEKILAHEDANVRKATTIRQIEHYFQTPVQVTSDISLTPQSALSQILFYSKEIGKLQELKVRFAQTPRDEDDKIARKQYQATVESFGVVLNFFMFVAQLYFQGCLDDRLFLNTFAMVFLRLWDAMAKVENVAKADIASQVEHLSTFKLACEKWIAAHPRTEGTVLDKSNSASMHSELEPLVKDLAEKQKTYVEANQKLDESMKQFLGTFMDDISPAAEDEHRRVWDEWIASLRAMEAAQKALRDQGMKLLDEARARTRSG